MSESYDPKTAFLGMKAGLKALSKKSRKAEMPQGLVSVAGDQLSAPTEIGPATTCVLLLAFLHRHPMVPDDFCNVERNKFGIENYIRPDGGVYLGTFELPKDPGGAVMVWGDPAMGPDGAAAASLAYRRRLHDSYETARSPRKPASTAPKDH